MNSHWTLNTIVRNDMQKEYGVIAEAETDAPNTEKNPWVTIHTNTGSHSGAKVWLEIAGWKAVL